MADIDERVLKMSFDNEGFEQGVDKTIDSLAKLNSSLSSIGNSDGKNVFDSLQNSANSVNFEALNQAIDTINYRFSDFGVAATRVIENLTDTVLEFSTTLVKSLTIDPVTAGWGEYNQLIDIARLMRANTEATMDEINAFTDRLNEYADKTKYNFINMAEGAKQFVQATGSLDYTFATGEVIDVEKLVEGATDYVALTGGSNANLANVLEVFSRALQTGEFSQEGMRRLTRNGAAGKIFEEVMRKAVENVGQTDAMNAAIEKAGSFLDALNKQKAGKYSGWANSDVVAEFLRILSDPTDPIGRKALMNATEATTFQELMDQSYEALQSGWTRIWRSIIGDLEEAKDVWNELNVVLNGEEGILTRYADWFGTLAEGWRELGGRENLIDGLMDALQGILNIVEAIKDTIANIFPGLDSHSLAEASEAFGNTTAKFKKWTEGLRGYFGDFIGGYDFWKEIIEDEPIHHTETWYDDVDYEGKLWDRLNPYMSSIQSWMAQLVRYDEEGAFDLKETKKAISEFDFSSTDYAAGDKDLKASMKTATQRLTATLAELYGGDDSLFRELKRDYYAGGVMSDEYFDSEAYTSDLYDMYSAILREMGIDSSSWGSEILEAAKHVEEWDEPQSHEERKHSARIVKGNDWFQQYVNALNLPSFLYEEGTVDGVVEIYNTSQGLVKILYGITSALRFIWDSVKNIHELLVKPLVSNILSEAITSAVEILGRFAERFTRFLNELRANYFIENLANGIRNFINNSVSFQKFFDDITSVFLKLNTIIWDVADNLLFMVEVVTNSPMILQIRAWADYIWRNLLGPLISNDTKAGAAAGGILGALFGGLKGFFTGGPLGMIIGGIQGLVKGATKGGALGSLVNVFNYLLNHTDQVLNIFRNIKKRIEELFDAFITGFKSVTVGDKNPLKRLLTFITTSLENLKTLVTGADPLGAINNFITSDTVNNVIQTLTKPFTTAGEIIGNVWEFISSNVGNFFSNIGAKWSLYMKQFDNNPLEAFFNMVKDSALVSALTSLGGVIADFFGSFKEGLFGKSEKDSAKAVEEQLSLYTRLTNWLRDAKKSLEEFKISDKFTAIRQFFTNLGTGIREFWTTIANGDLFGIIVGGFQTVGSVVGTFFQGIMGLPAKLSDAFKSNDKDTKTFSERIHDIKTSIDEFLQGDGITNLKENIYSFGETIRGFFSDAIEFGSSALGTFFDFITNNSVIDFFKELKDTIWQFASSLIEGFTGIDFKDNVIGLFELLTDKLREFKASDVFDDILNKIESVGQKLSDLLSWFTGLFSKEKEKSDETGGIFSGLTSLFSDFSLSTFDLGKTEAAITETVNDTIQNVEDAVGKAEEKKPGSDIGYLFKSIFEAFTGGHSVGAAELDDVLEQTEGAKEIVTQTGDAINEINNQTVTPDPNADPEKKNSMFSWFGSLLSWLGGVIKSNVWKVVAGLGLAIVASVIVSILRVVHGIGNLASIVNSVSTLLRAKSLIKLGEFILMLTAAIAGLTFLMSYFEIDPQYLLYSTTAVLTVLVAATLIFSAIGVKSGTLADTAKKGLDGLKDSVVIIAEGAKEAISGIANAISRVITVAAFIAALLAVTYVIVKIAREEDIEKIQQVGFVVAGIAAGLIVVMAALAIISKIISKDTAIKMIAVSGSLLAIGAGIYLVVEAVIKLKGFIDELGLAGKGFEEQISIIGPTLAALTALIGILVLAAWGISATIGKNPVKAASVAAASIGVLAIAAAIVLMSNSIIKMIEATKDKDIKADEALAVVMSLGVIIAALGAAVWLMQRKGKAVSLRTSASLIALALAVKMLVPTLVSLMNDIVEIEVKLKNNDLSTSSTAIGSAIAAIGIILLALGGAVALMKGDAVKIRSIIALGALLAAVAIVMVEVNALIALVDEKGIESSTIALFGIAIIIGGLVAAVKALQTKSIQDKEKTTTGFAAAIAAIILIAGVWAALQMIKDLKGQNLEDYSTGFIVVGGILAALTIAVTAIQKASKGAQIGPIIATMIVLLGGIALVMSSLGGIAKDLEGAGDVLTIAESLSMVVAVVGIITAILTKISADNNKNKIGQVKGLEKTLNENANSLITIIAIIAAAGVALTLMANNIEDTSGLMDIALAMTEFIGALAVLTYLIAKIGPLAGGVEAGLAAVGKVAGAITIVIGIVASIWDIIQELKNSKNGAASALGDFLEQPIENIGELLKSLAGFIGDVVHEFKAHSSLANDAEEMAKGTSDVTSAVNDMATNLGEVDITSIDKVKEVIEAFTGLESAMVVQNTGTHLTNVFELFGNDLDKFTDPFVHFVQSIIGLQNGEELDLDRIQSICTAIETIGKIEYDNGGTFSKKGIGVLGGDLDTLGQGLFDLYGYAIQMTDESAITRTISIIEAISKAFSSTGEDGSWSETYSEIVDKIDLIQRIADGVKTASGKLDKTDPEKLNTLGVIIESLASIYANAGALNAEDLGTASTFFEGLNLSNILSNLDNTVDNSEGINKSVENVVHAISMATLGKYEDLKLIGDTIGNDIMIGLKEYSTGEDLADSIGYVIEGLQNGIDANEENVLKVGQTLATKLKQGFDQELVIESPSEEFKKRGMYIVQGLINGIENSEDRALEVMRQLGEELGMAFTDSVDGEKLFGSLSKGKLLLARNERNASKKLNYITPDDEAERIIKQYYNYLHGVAKDTYDKDKINQFTKYRDNLKGLYDSADKMPDKVKRIISKLNNDIVELKNNRATGFDSKLEEDITDAVATATEPIENMVNDAMDGVSDTVDTFTENVNSLLEEVDYTDPLSINKAINKLSTLYDDTIGSMGGGKSFFTSDDAVGLYSIFSEASDWLSDGLASLTGTVSNGFSSVKKSLLKDFAWDEQICMISQAVDAIRNGEATGSIMDFIRDNFNVSATSSELAKVLESDYIAEALAQLGWDIDPKMFKQLVNTSGSIEDLFAAFANNGININASEFVDGLSGIQEALGSLGAGNLGSDLFGDLSSLLGVDATSVGLDVEDGLGDVLSGFASDATDAVEQVDERITEMAWRVISGEFGNNPDREQLLEGLGLSFGVIQNEVNRLLGCNFRYATSSEDLQRTLAALGDTTQAVEESVAETNGTLQEFEPEEVIVIGEEVDNLAKETEEKTAWLNNAIREKLSNLISQYYELDKYAKANGLSTNASWLDLKKDKNNIDDLLGIRSAYQLEIQRASKEGRVTDISKLIEDLNNFMEVSGTSYSNVNSQIYRLIDKLENGDQLYPSEIRTELDNIITVLKGTSEDTKVTFSDKVKEVIDQLEKGGVGSYGSAMVRLLSVAMELEQAKQYTGLSDAEIDEIMGGLNKAVDSMNGAIAVANDENFKEQPTITPVVNAASIETSGIPEMFPNGKGAVPINFNESSGFDNVNNISAQFDKNLNDNAKILSSMDELRNELGLLREAAYSAQVVLDSGALVGELTPEINRRLQVMNNRLERGIR